MTIWLPHTALELLLLGDLGDVFNVGTGLGYSVRQIPDVIRAETGEAIPFTSRERPPGDPPILVTIQPRRMAVTLQGQPL